MLRVAQGEGTRLANTGPRDMMRIRDLMFMLSSVAVTAACAGLQDDAMLAQAAATETAYVNGRIIEGTRFSSLMG